MGGCPITNQVARKALVKLEAVSATQPNDPHPIFDVVYNGKIVASTGLRRSSKRYIPLRHVNKDLRVPIHFVLDLARCPKSRDDYLREIGELKDEDAEKGETEDVSEENGNRNQGSADPS